jgi:nucleoside-diphosphate-sugar epimerase
MKVFVAGATGALGKQLVPQLIAAGHEVTGMTRSASKQDLVRSLGAKPVVADALDPDQVARVVAEAEPEAIIHQLTAISADMNPRNLDRAFAQTNRLRTEGTDHLLAAAKAVGAKRFLVQSFAGWPFARIGGPVKTEEDPLDQSPPKHARETIAAIRYLERAVTGADWIEGIALRYGGFYGPGTSLSREPGAEQAEMIRKRRFPIVGGGTGIQSFIQIEDAGAATVAAVDRGDPGVYNVADDEPAPISEWLPVLADALGAKAPRRVPRWLGRLAAGQVGVVMMTEVRGASNAKAKRELGWELKYPSWRQGFREGLG